jgi:hypothetical protein
VMGRRPLAASFNTNAGFAGITGRKKRGGSYDRIYS